MTASATKRPLLMWGALLTTLAATAWVAASDDVTSGGGVVAPAAVHAIPALTSMRVSERMPETLVFSPRPRIEHDPEDLFSGEPPPTEEPIDLRPAKPTTPPLPFSYAGKLIEDGQTVVFLLHGSRNLAVRTGDVIDGVWRVELIQPTAMTLAYLPLNTVVPLTIGVSN